MPPKKLKDLSSAPVYTMPHEQQVRLLSDALLREYMHRRGYLSTLQAFDEENPRDSETVSSRALMADLMALEQGDQQRLKAEGIETIMEMLCDLRVEKRLEVEKLTAEAARPLPEAPTEEEVATLKTALEDKRASLSAGKRHKTAKLPSEKEKERKRKDRKKEKKKKKSKDDGKTAAAATGEASSAAAGESTGVTLDDLLGSSGSSSSSSVSGSGSERQVEDVDAQGAKSTAPSWLSDDQAKGGNAGGSAAGKGAYARGPSAPGKASDPTGRGDSASDSGESDDDEDSAAAAGAAGGGVEGGSPMDAATAEAVCKLLCGRAAHMPPLSFLQQGFTFDEGHLDYALVQWRRGPGAVVAVVQSLVITYMYEKEVYVSVKTRQLDCLRRALSTVLFRAQPNPRSIVLVNGALSARHPQKSFADKVFSPPEGAASKNGFHVWRDFESAEEVEDLLGDFLPEEGEQWLAAKGCGLWCFLLSVCLSRGVDAIRKDMGVGGAAKCLLDESTGDGGRELLHLMLTGRATATPQPRGISAQPSGLLDGDAVDRNSAFGGDDGAREGDGPPHTGAIPVALTNPGYPSWVVHHRSHYSNLFMKKDTRKVFRQKKELSGSASAEIVYWDPLTEDDEYTLTIEVAGLGGGLGSGQKRRLSSAGSSFVNVAVQGVPDWAKATVDWNGESPPK